MGVSSVLRFISLSAIFGFVISDSLPDWDDPAATLLSRRDILKRVESMRRELQRFRRDVSLIPDLEALEDPDDDQELSIGYEVPDLSISCVEKCNLDCQECKSRVKVCKNVTSQVCSEKPGTSQVVLLDRQKCSPVKKQVCKDTYAYGCKEVPRRKCQEVQTQEMVWVVGSQCQGSDWGAETDSAWKELRVPRSAKGVTKRSISKWKHSPSKCRPQMKWQSVPKWTTVCHEEWVDVCETRPMPTCDFVEDVVCSNVQVQEVVTNPPVQSCRDVVHEICSDGLQCEEGEADCLSNHPECQDACIDCNLFCNGGSSHFESPAFS